MQSKWRKLVPLGLAALLAVLVVGCGGGDDTSATGGGETTAAETGPTEESAGSAFGSPNKATGEPIVLGMLNLENGPVAFPQYREAAEAAAEYVNEYKGGIHGRPIQIVNCATDGQPATSTRCANQILEKDPLFILGAADTGATGSMPVYERAGLAYIGGAPLTPAESTSKNAAIFISIVVADNAAAAAYAKETLGAKSAAAINIADTQGKYTGEIITTLLEGAGMEVDDINVAPTASDLSSPAAEAVSAGADLIYVQMPNACAPMLKALESVGNTGPVISVAACASPLVIEAAGPAAEDVYFSEPFELLTSSSEAAEATTEILDKYVSPEMPRETFAQTGFASVMNIYQALNEAPESALQSDKILSVFTAGSEHPNWLAHPYTCDRKQVPSQEAVCNGYSKITQVKGGEIVSVSEDWVNGTQYFTP